MKLKRLKKDIIIPAGTIFNNVPSGLERKFISKEFYEKCIGLTKDSCGDFIYYVDPSDPKLNEWFEDIE